MAYVEGESSVCKRRREAMEGNSPKVRPQPRTLGVAPGGAAPRPAGMDV